MKKYIALLCAVVTCVGVLSACAQRGDTSPQQSTAGQGEPPVQSGQPEMDETVPSVDKNQLDETEIEVLAEGLLSKALHLCFLAHAENLETGQSVFGETHGEEFVVENGARYLPVTALPYASTLEMWDDIYSVFSKDTADSQFAFMFPGLYADFDGKLYGRSDADGQGKQRDWDVSAMEIESMTEDLLRLRMNVQFMDNTFPAILEVVYENGRWVLNDSYFANPQ